MTGRELIMWILVNKLEDSELLKDGEVYGFTSIEKAAAELEFGPASVQAMMLAEGMSPHIIGDKMYISIQDMMTLMSKKERFKCATK